MKITIIVPVYNVEQYIRECFDSIAAQTYKGELECIFVDDCGQDKSVEVLEKLMAGYQGNIVFRLVHHEQNKGLSGARNTGIKYATGEYLYFLDSDDTITPDCIERLVALAMKYPGVELVQGSTKSHRKWLSLCDKKLPEYSSDKQWIQQTMLLRYIIPLTSWNKLILRRIVMLHQLFFVEGLIHEDELWNFMIAKYVNTIAFCIDETYIYRENPEGIMQNVDNIIYHLQYKDLVSNMAHNITYPCVSTQIECLDSILDEHVGYISKELTYKLAPVNYYVICVFLRTRKNVLGTSSKSLVGVMNRAIYHILGKVLDFICKNKAK